MIGDALCNGCGGRVMSYTQYAAHFRPTAVCESCGGRVRMRHYRRVVSTALLAAAVLGTVVWLTRSLAVAATVTALATLLGFLADFWTFRNLSWDPEEETSPSREASA